jgi:hypothetical protein
VNLPFNEREFEFCFNSEWVRKNKACLLGTPVIPTTNAERFRGYDVGFEIKRGRYCRSLFLQHKVPVYIDRLAGTNVRFMAKHPGGAYLRFRLRHTPESQQHNTLVDLATKDPSYRVYYSLPLFHSYSDLREYLAADRITDNSRLLSIRRLPRITDSAPHNITLDPDGRRACFHSDPVEFQGAISWEEMLQIDQGPEEEIISDDYLAQLRTDLKTSIDQTHQVPADIPAFVSQAGPAAEIAYLAALYLDADWYLLPW